MEKLLKVLIADDSIVYRKLLSNILSHHQDIELIGVAPNGEIALSKIELKKPDLVLLDVAMPGKDGLDVLKEIRRKKIDIDVVFVSGMNRENAEITVRALESGALDFVPKPEGNSPDESFNKLKSALDPILRLAKTRYYTRQARQKKEGAPARQQPTSSASPSTISQAPKRSTPIQEKPASACKGQEKRTPPRIDAVAIGVSTGGPNALTRLIPALPGDLPVPVLIVQHMPATFTASLAERLNSRSNLSVVEAEDGIQPQKGYVYIAPGGKHMVARLADQKRAVIGITNSPPVHNCKPSVDTLFRSLALVYQKHVLPVILTGMGSDGAAGVAAIRRQGGYCLIQDEATSVVWGMPAAVLEAGDADEILDLAVIARRITDIVTHHRR